MDFPSVIGERYILEEEIGRGGSSRVYRGRHIHLGIEYAIKIVDKKKIGNIDPRNEALILKDLNHRIIPKVLDVFQDEDNIFIIREFCRGETIRDYVSANGPMSFERIQKIGVQIADVLGYVHSQNPPLIYRDLKPSNVIIAEDDKIKLIDFGITRKYRKEQDDDTQYIGSQKYAAPEQFGVSQSTPKTDIYSFALLMYYMYTGEDYIEQTPEERWTKFISEREIRLKKAILKAINIDPGMRPTDANSIIAEVFLTNEDEKETEFLESEITCNDQAKTSNTSIKVDKPNFMPYKTKINIGFMGLKSGMGVSHIAFTTAIMLKNLGYKTLLVEESSRRGFEELYGYTIGDGPLDGINYENFKIDGVEVFSQNSKLNIPTILSKDYDIAVFDFGASHSHIGDFLRMQTKIFVIPSSPYALNKNTSLISEILSYEDIRVCVNLAQKDSHKLMNWLKIPKCRRYGIDFIIPNSLSIDQENTLLEICGIKKTKTRNKRGLLKSIFI